VLLIAFLSAAGMSTTAKVRVVDDSDREIVLTGPAERIISLAPNLTELLFVAGAGDRIVGTVRYSDYPEAAKSIPRIGDSHHIDLEAVIALRPDLIVAWKSGTGVAALEKLLQLNVPLYLSEPDTLEEEDRRRLRSMYASYRLDQVAHFICLVDPEDFEEAVDRILDGEAIDFRAKDRVQFAMMVVEHIEAHLPLPPFDVWARDYLDHTDSYRLYGHALHREGKLP